MNEETEQVQDEPGDYVISGFIAPCVHGDVIWKGDTIRRVPVNSGEFEHKECAEYGAAVFGERMPLDDPAMDSDDELSGMWSRSDFTGGSTDTPPYEGDGFDPYQEDVKGPRS